MFTYYSLFAGIGGMTMGLEELGFKCLGAWEYDPFSKRQYAQEAHKLLHPHIPVHDDVTKIVPEELEDFDLLAFTPPCQSFSMAGKRGGFEDTRGTLVFDVLQIAKVKQPKMLFMENVKGMLNHDKEKTISVICHAINEIGYYVDFTILNSKFFDVAQNRERLYLTAIRKDLIEQQEWEIDKSTTLLNKVKRKLQKEGLQTFNFDFPEETEVRTKLKDFLEPNVDERYYLSEDKTAVLNDLAGCSYRTRSYRNQPQQLEVRTDDVSNTITSVQKDSLLLEVYRVRKLTPRENFRLQAIPEKYIDLLLEHFSSSRCIKFAGNGLTINVIRAIGEKITMYLNK